MKKKLISLLFLLGLVLVISPMVLSCSDKDEPAVEPDVPVTPDVPLPPVPTPIRWVENEVDGGERGVGIKVTTIHNYSACIIGKSEFIPGFPEVLCHVLNLIVDDSADIDCTVDNDCHIDIEIRFHTSKKLVKDPMEKEGDREKEEQ